MKRRALFFSYLLVLVLGSELAVRSWHRAWPFDDPAVLPPYLDENEHPLGWRAAPAEGRNRLGLRPPDPLEKREGTLRILVLGDSLVHWGETSDGPLYTEVLERRLNLQGDRGEKIDVLNAGVVGYTTFQELLFLRYYGETLEPDVVVLAFVLNDVYDPYLHRPRGDGTLIFEPARALGRFDGRSFPGRLVARSYLAHDLVRVVERTIGPAFPPLDRNDLYLAWESHAWDRTGDLLAEMRRTVKALGATLEVMVFPTRAQLDPAWAHLDEAFRLYPQRRVRELCERHGLELLDLTPALESAGGASLFTDHVHLARDGNDVVAEALHRWLSARLPPAADRDPVVDPDPELP